MTQRQPRTETLEGSDEEIDRAVELIRAFEAIKDPVLRKQLLDVANHLAKGGKIQ